ncbi:hypothetical protein M2447_001669 [Ereboglobus sp. PH5-10]|nr:hypothetical protein [Ereboglobus sp. PH5-10]
MYDSREKWRKNAINHYNLSKIASYIHIIKSLLVANILTKVVFFAK